MKIRNSGLLFFTIIFRYPYYLCKYMNRLKNRFKFEQKLYCNVNAKI